MESVVDFTESRISTRVPSWRSIASCVRSLGTRGLVLSIVDGDVIIAILSAVAIAADLNARKMKQRHPKKVSRLPKNPIFVLLLCQRTDRRELQ